MSARPLIISLDHAHMNEEPLLALSLVYSQLLAYAPIVVAIAKYNATLIFMNKRLISNKCTANQVESFLPPECHDNAKIYLIRNLTHIK